MDSSETKAIVATFIDRFSAGDYDGAFALLADDMTWHIWGTGPGAGIFDKAAMLGQLRGAQPLFASGPVWTPVSFTAEDNRVAVEIEGRATTRNGHDYRNAYHNLFVLDDGRITEIRELCRDEPVEGLLAALSG